MDQIINDILCNVKEYLKGLTGDDKFYASASHTHTKNQITDFKHGNESHSETYAKQSDLTAGLNTKVGKDEAIAISKVTNLVNQLDAKASKAELNTAKSELQSNINTLQNNIDNKSKVEYSPNQTSGDKIGTLTIDGSNNILYSKPYSSTNDITDPNKHSNIGTNKNATQSDINTSIDTKILSLQHPATHSAGIILDPNAHTNIGSAINAKQSDINTKIDTKISTLNTNINNKVDKSGSKVLSTNDFTNDDKNKLDSITEGAKAKKRMPGFFVASPKDQSNQGLVTIRHGTRLQLILYNQDYLTGANDTGVTYQQALDYAIPNITIGYAIHGVNSTLKTNGGDIGIDGLSYPDEHLLHLIFAGSGNYYQVYRTVVIKIEG